MKKTRKRRYRRRRRRRGGFSFKRPKFKKPNFSKKLGKMKNFGKKTLKKAKDVGKKGLGAVGKVGKMGMQAMGSPMGMMAGLGGLGALGFLAASMGGIPMDKFKKFAKWGGMLIAPLLLLGSFIKPGAKVIYNGLKSIVTMIIYKSKDGIAFLINLGGVPIKGLMHIIGNLPALMMAMGGFASIAWLVSKNYLSWIWKSWRHIADGWSSSPLLTWCEKKPDGTCRCPQTLRIVKKDGKPAIVVEKKKKGWLSSGEGKGCFMNRQCPSGWICKKANRWSPRGKCAQTSTSAMTQPMVTPPTAEGKGCFMNRQCPSGWICKKANKWSPRGKCAQTSTSAMTQPMVTPPTAEGKGCFMNRQCPSGWICKKANKWSPRGKCAQTSTPAMTQPMVTPPPSIEGSNAPLVSQQGIKMFGGGKFLDELKPIFNILLQAETTKKGIKWKYRERKGRKRR